MTEAQFELLLAATREQHQELRAILGRLRGISYALYIILGILAGASMIWLGLAWLALRDAQFW
jgi:hypothetical protein